MCIRDRSLREQIEQTNADIEKAQREYDLNKAAELKYGKLPQLQKQLEEEEKIAAAKKEDSLLRDRVTDEEIARIVARLTGSPVEKLVEGEREKLLHLDPSLIHISVTSKVSPGLWPTIWSSKPSMKEPLPSLRL